MSLPEVDLWDLLNDGWDRMTGEERRLWEAIRLLPQQWQLPGHGPCWIVALVGSHVIYYNHFENGFNRSAWSQYGVIDDYQSLQRNLDAAIRHQLDIIRTGYDAGPRSGPPIAGVYEP